MFVISCFLREPLPCNPAAETALQPLIWCSESLFPTCLPLQRSAPFHRRLYRRYEHERADGVGCFPESRGSPPGPRPGSPGSHIPSAVPAGRAPRFFGEDPTTPHPILSHPTHPVLSYPILSHPTPSYPSSHPIPSHPIPSHLARRAEAVTVVAFAPLPAAARALPP